MLQILKDWLVSICTTVFFITAVEIILPDNGMRKYAKFVLGLILITVFINPIIKIFDRNFDISTYVNSAVSSSDTKKLQDDFQKYKEKNISSTLEVFKLNLQTSCEKKLKEKYPESNYKVQVDASYDNKNDKLLINDIKVGVKDGSIEKIQKVHISFNSKYVNTKNNVEDERSISIKRYLSDQLSISSDKIQVYKL